MSCNKITPPEFTKEQIAECKTCKHASGKKIWCCHFGVWIVEKGKILTPSRKIITPFPKNDKEFNKSRFQRNYLVAVVLAKGSNKTIVSEATFIKRRQGCVICPPEDKAGCPCVGCKRWSELVFVETECPTDKW